MDIEKDLLAINAELHSDLEKYLLDNGSNNRDLYGINILLDDFEIEFESLINPPRNREAGFPRVGRDVADPVAREKIVEVVNKWIELYGGLKWVLENRFLILAVRSIGR